MSNKKELSSVGTSKVLKVKKEKQALLTDYEISDKGKQATLDMVNANINDAIATTRTGVAGAKAFGDYANEDYSNLVDSGLSTLRTMPSFLSAKVDAVKKNNEYRKVMSAEMKGMSLANKSIIAKAYAEHTAITAAEVAASRTEGNEDAVKKALSDVQNSFDYAMKSQNNKKSRKDSVIDGEWKEVQTDVYESRSKQADKLLSNISSSDCSSFEKQ